MSIRGQGQGRLGALPIPFATALPSPRTRPAGPDHAATARHTWHTPPHRGWQARRHAPAKPIPPTHVGTARHRQPPSSEAKHARVSPSLTASTPPTLPRGTGSSQRQPQQRHPGEGTGGTGATPPLGFRHLRHNLDRSRGTAQARVESRLHSHSPRQGDSEGCPPRHRTPAPPRAQKHGDSRGRAGFRTPATHTPPTGGEGRTRGPQARTRGSAAFAMNGRPSSGAA